jgi:EAL domain-containing protein (putative c-di-GMP-specific phosphodiesterase class I)
VPGHTGAVKGVRVALEAGGLSPHQSVHALRMLLDRFSRSGAAAAGLEGGLAGVIEQANTHKRVLADMIARGRFTMAYQPVVCLADRRVHHYEALLRPMADPENPTANPQEFVALVEAVGLAVELDLAVLQRSLDALRQGEVRIAVNVSGLSIADPRFEAEVLSRLDGIGSGRLLIELTETAEIEDLASVAGRIERIRAAGVPICLDDFGAGSASFRYLRDLRVTM